MNRITDHTLRNMLAGIKGARMCTIVCSTVPDMRKTNNPFVGRIRKVTRMNVTVNFIYANSVNNQRSKEGNEQDFVPHPRKWGQRINKTCLVEHNGRLYLECKPNAAPQSVEYFDTITNQPIDKSLLEPFLRERSSMKEHQGVEKEIIVRDVCLDNIVEIIINKKHYLIDRQ